jgi:hypothetical protein
VKKLLSIDRKRMRGAREALARLDLDIDPDQPVGVLSL